MHTSLPTWLALSAATILPGVTAFYPYHYDAVNASPSPPRPQRLSRASNDNTVRSITLPLRRIATNLRSRQSNTYNIVSSKKPSQDKSVAIDQDGRDLSYMVAVTFGDSKEEYHLLLDSAASNTWVMGQDCTSEACKTHNLFGKGDSSTVKTDTKAFSMTYGTGSASGTLASDTIHLGSTLSSPLTFGLANNVSDEFRAYPMDGILGIGRGSATKQDGEIDAPQIMDVLSSSQLIPSKLYGIHLSRASDSLSDGALDIGHIDKSRFSGDLNYLECVENDTGFWEIPLEGASVDGTDAALGTGASRTAIMDTGTSFILMPLADAKAIHAPINNMVQNGESFFVPCDTTASLAFSFNKQSYNISSKDWMGDEVDGDSRNLCRSNIIGRQTFGEHQWLVGDVFLKNVYAVFDFEAKRVGFGVKSSSSGDGGNEPSTASASASASSASPTTTPSASGVARPSVSAAAEKAPQGQANSGVATADLSSSSSGLALVVAFAAIFLFV